MNFITQNFKISILNQNLNKELKETSRFQWLWSRIFKKIIKKIKDFKKTCKNFKDFKETTKFFFSFLLFFSCFFFFFSFLFFFLLFFYMVKTWCKTLKKRLNEIKDDKEQCKNEFEKKWEGVEEENTKNEK